ncbi:TPA: twin-arginine translocase TatA/TatE family subunit [Candidatus Collierbacteria bacterium]|uniref:Twin-arginine translocation protein TatA n=1 Tax=Candidatus Collierbacteria bacterium GW2011_GWB2_44_22 TaxID=1618387 RepID=A0A0G1HYT0_9BACT|nr:MAG: Twin-arginine translocation protein TatA [Candidatus Collierbacteria bacterium GW2011_GWA2_44_13]KKT50121.1 MAG: Twin-arginine translocation protein TatA [Candidatus Collierbacteria bacterium GW2011_GWB1_44_197]KKT51728.1 MAG: Twin-arginine translocation protein TatA [Candidatus Collierbacteria bacterium GW2011_GWB2_44_22]KKT62524.1 MAG: Twin-arginine translocation protein TatA [Candidatus Collierbacteria bacterium GW2011_GWD1_44_27]KKT66947.1 MAG: Twin-arginine translocation protein Ta
MFGNIGPSELLLIGMVLFLLFGGKKLPELTRGLIDSIRQFRTAFKEGASDSETKK